MATSILVRSARSALKSADLASRCLPATGTTAWTAMRLGQSYRFFCQLYQYSPEQAKLREARKLANDIVQSEETKRREALKLTDDIVNSEAELRALFKKWLSFSRIHHFDVEDRKAFEERFAIFKGKAQRYHQHNKKGDSTYTLGLTPFADLTRQEFAGRKKCKVYPKKEVPESYLDV